MGVAPTAAPRGSMSARRATGLPPPYQDALPLSRERGSAPPPGPEREPLNRPLSLQKAFWVVRKQV